MFGSIFGIDGQTLMIIIGAGLFIWLTISRLDKTGIGNNMVNRLIVICVIAALTMIIGARFFDCLWHATDNGYFENLPKLIDEVGIIGAIFKKNSDPNGDPIGFFDQGGITFLGGLYGAIFGYLISYWFIFKHERHNIIHYLNIILPGLILAHGLGRVGCFLVGCCTGIKAPEPFGMIFPYSGDEIAKVHTVLPTNLYEAIFLFILFAILFFGIKKNQTKIYMLSYGVFRFFLEFLRGDSRGKVPFIDFLTPSQFLSLIMIIVGILLFVFENKLTDWFKKFNKPLKVKKMQEKKEKQNEA